MSVKCDACATGLEFRQHGSPISVRLLPLPATGGSPELETRIKKEVMS